MPITTAKQFVAAVNSYDGKSQVSAEISNFFTSTEFVALLNVYDGMREVRKAADSASASRETKSEYQEWARIYPEIRKRVTLSQPNKSYVAFLEMTRMKMIASLSEIEWSELLKLKEFNGEMLEIVARFLVDPGLQPHLNAVWQQLISAHYSHPLAVVRKKAGSFLEKLRRCASAASIIRPLPNGAANVFIQPLNYVQLAQDVLKSNKIPTDDEQKKQIQAQMQAFLAFGVDSGSIYHVLHTKILSFQARIRNPSTEYFHTLLSDALDSMPSEWMESSVLDYSRFRLAYNGIPERRLECLGKIKDWARLCEMAEFQDSKYGEGRQTNLCSCFLSSYNITADQGIYTGILDAYPSSSADDEKIVALVAKVYRQTANSSFLAAKGLRKAIQGALESKPKLREDVQRAINADAKELEEQKVVASSSTSSIEYPKAAESEDITNCRNQCNALRKTVTDHREELKNLGARQTTIEQSLSDMSSGINQALCAIRSDIARARLLAVQNNPIVKGSSTISNSLTSISVDLEAILHTRDEVANKARDAISKARVQQSGLIKIDDDLATVLNILDAASPRSSSATAATIAGVQVRLRDAKVELGNIEEKVKEVSEKASVYEKKAQEVKDGTDNSIRALAEVPARVAGIIGRIEKIEDEVKAREGFYQQLEGLQHQLEEKQPKVDLEAINTNQRAVLEGIKRKTKLFNDNSSTGGPEMERLADQYDQEAKVWLDEEEKLEEEMKKLRSNDSFSEAKVQGDLKELAQRITAHNLARVELAQTKETIQRAYQKSVSNALIRVGTAMKWFIASIDTTSESKETDRVVDECKHYGIDTSQVQPVLDNSLNGLRKYDEIIRKYYSASVKEMAALARDAKNIESQECFLKKPERCGVERNSPLIQEILEQRQKLRETYLEQLRPLKAKVAAKQREIEEQRQREADQQRALAKQKREVERKKQEQKADAVPKKQVGLLRQIAWGLAGVGCGLLGFLGVVVDLAIIGATLTGAYWAGWKFKAAGKCFSAAGSCFNEARGLSEKSEQDHAPKAADEDVWRQFLSTSSSFSSSSGSAVTQVDRVSAVAQVQSSSSAATQVTIEVKVAPVLQFRPREVKEPALITKETIMPSLNKVFANDSADTVGNVLTEFSKKYDKLTWFNTWDVEAFQLEALEAKHGRKDKIISILGMLINYIIQKRAEGNLSDTEKALCHAMGKRDWVKCGLGVQRYNEVMTALGEKQQLSSSSAFFTPVHDHGSPVSETPSPVLYGSSTSSDDSTRTSTSSLSSEDGSRSRVNSLDNNSVVVSVSDDESDTESRVVPVSQAVNA